MCITVHRTWYEKVKVVPEGYDELLTYCYIPLKKNDKLFAMLVLFPQKITQQEKGEDINIHIYMLYVRYMGYTLQTGT